MIAPLAEYIDWSVLQVGGLPFMRREPVNERDSNLEKAVNLLPRICDVLASYVGRTVGTNTTSATVFKRPVDKMGRFAAEGSSYEWNADLNGHRFDETRTDSAFRFLRQGDISGGITNFVLTFPPGTTPLFLDYDDFHPRPPKPGKNVVFMDGHVAPLEADSD